MSNFSIHNLERSQFDKLLPKKVKEVIELMEKKGCTLTLVGGASREYLVSNTLGKDLDFEVRSAESFDEDKWKNLFLSVKEYTFEEIGLDVFLTEAEGHGLEFSPPRIESYDQYERPYGHKDFDVEYSFQFDYATSFRRRDFTINAIGLELGENKLLIQDPYNGLQDLKDKKLRACGPDFFKDPIRFLRAIRFHLKFDFKLPDGLEQFDLTKATRFYFLKEGFKVGIVKFAKSFFSTVKSNRIAIPASIKCFSFLSDCDFEAFDKMSLLLQVRDQGTLSFKELEQFAQDLSLPKKALKD